MDYGFVFVILFFYVAREFKRRYTRTVKMTFIDRSCVISIEIILFLATKLCIMAISIHAAELGKILKKSILIRETWYIHFL